MSQANTSPDAIRNTGAPHKRVDLRMQPMTDVVEYAKQYAREKPEVAALWCFGIGFLVGWKVKPW